MYFYTGAFFAAGTDGGGRCCSNPPATIPLICFYKTETPASGSDTGVLGGEKQPKSEPLPSGASLAAISSKVMAFVPSFVRINLWSTPSLCWVVRLSIISHSAVTMADLED